VKAEHLKQTKTHHQKQIMYFSIFFLFLSLCLKMTYGNEGLFVRLKIPSDSLSVPKIYFEMKEVKSKIGCGAICASQRNKCSAFFFNKEKAFCQLADVENGTIKNDSLVDFTYVSLGKFKLK
jgi:hypothetical protein